MTTKKTKTTKSEKPVGVTLYFEGAALVAKLVKRVPGQNYKRAQTLIEEAFWKRFGKERVIHVPGSTKTHVVGATVEQANHISGALSLHDDVISLVYSRPEEVDVPAPKNVDHRTAIAALKGEVESLDRTIKVNKEDLLRWQAQLEKTQGYIDENTQRRSDLIATIKALKA